MSRTAHAKFRSVDVLASDRWRARYSGPDEIRHAARIRIAAPAEITALAEAIAPRYRAPVLVAAYTGLHPREVLALTTNDVNLTEATITVRRSLTVISDQPTTPSQSKTQAGRRTIALPSVVVEALTDHLRAWPVTNIEGFIFTTSAARPLSANARSLAMHRANTLINDPGINWRHLRHAGATAAFK